MDSGLAVLLLSSSAREEEGEGLLRCEVRILREMGGAGDWVLLEC